jgi:hypothetical protein
MAKFRFHWGWAIGVFYTVFVIAILSLVIKSFTVDNALVVDDYYSKDISYQEHADKVNNSKALKEDVAFEYDREVKQLKLVFPADFENYSGKIHFYKPDNKKLDFELELEIDQDHQQMISLEKIVSGYWKVKINWKGNDTAFYKEFTVYK